MGGGKEEEESLHCLLRLMLDSYPGLEAFIPRAQFYNQTFALQDALHGLAHNDRAAFQEGITPYV